MSTCRCLSGLARQQARLVPASAYVVVYGSYQYRFLIEYATINKKTGKRFLFYQKAALTGLYLLACTMQVFVLLTFWSPVNIVIYNTFPVSILFNNPEYSDNGYSCKHKNKIFAKFYLYVL